MSNTPESSLTPNQSEQTNRSFSLFIVASGLMTMVLGIILLTRGRFTQLLIEFDRPCPFLTGLCLSIYLPLSLVLIALATLVIEYSSASARSKNLWNATAVMLSLVWLATYALGISFFLIPLLNDLA